MRLFDKPVMQDLCELHPEFAALHQFDAYLEILQHFFKFNNRTVHFIHDYYSKIALPFDCDYISVHIRKGDKTKLEQGENVANLPVERYLEAISYISEVYEMEHVYLTSDMIGAYDLFKEHALEVNGVANPEFSASEHQPRYGRWKLHYIETSDFDNQNAFQGNEAGLAVHAREISLIDLSNFMILARAKTMIGGFYSNFERMGMLFQTLYRNHNHVFDIEGLSLRSFVYR
jgi:hypothetical protein